MYDNRCEDLEIVYIDGSNNPSTPLLGQRVQYQFPPESATELDNDWN